MRDGVAVGDASTRHPTGVLVTKDGGKTWRPMAGRKSDGWRTADFLSPEIGAVAGTNGQHRRRDLSAVDGGDGVS